MTYNEKKDASGVVSLVEQPESISNGTESETGSTWSPEEEAALVRKIDLLVIPILWIGFYALQLDRGNIGNAMTDNFLVDVGINQNQFNIGGSLLSLGIVLMEIPSNIILMRLGPKLWIGGQIVAWGLVATFQAFQYGLGAFLSTRLLLGICEAGFIPAALYTLTLWYRTEELSKRFSIFFTGNILAIATGSLMAFGILHMRGIAGLAGWQWLFILEGMFTVVVGIIFIVTFPGSPTNPVSILGISWFSEREVSIMRRRILLDDATKTAEKHKITAREVLNSLANWKLWPHLLMPMAGMTPGIAFNHYGPTLIITMGYGHLKANALASVGQFIGACLMLSAGFVADKTGRRGIVALSCMCIEFVLLLAYKFLPSSTGRGGRYGLFTIASATMMWWHPINNSWLAVNARSPAERSMRMAYIIMSANISGIIGSQLFRQEDAPHYPLGFIYILCLLAFAVICAGVAVAGYAVSNARLRKKYGVESAHSGSGGESPRDGSLVHGSHSEEGVRLYNF